MKIILSSKKLKKLSKQINRYCKNIPEQPITLDVNIKYGDLSISINSEKTIAEFELWSVDVIKPKQP